MPSNLFAGLAALIGSILKSIVFVFGGGGFGGSPGFSPSPGFGPLPGFYSSPGSNRSPSPSPLSCDWQCERPDMDTYSIKCEGKDMKGKDSKDMVITCLSRWCTTNSIKGVDPYVRCYPKKKGSLGGIALPGLGIDDYTHLCCQAVDLTGATPGGYGYGGR